MGIVGTPPDASIQPIEQTQPQVTEHRENSILVYAEISAGLTARVGNEESRDFIKAHLIERRDKPADVPEQDFYAEAFSKFGQNLWHALMVSATHLNSTKNTGR